MPIVFSAITPHPPILIPNIGKENLDRLKNTQKAFETLKKSLEEKRPDDIIVISPHGPINEQVFRINHCPNYSANFEDFGDFSTKKTWKGDIHLGYQIRKALETQGVIQLISEEELDHGTSIPLTLLTEKIDTKIIPLYYSGKNLNEHFEFGKKLFQIVHKRQNRIAIIASGDLSHRLQKDAPGGFSKKAKKFDNKLTTLLQKNKPEDILQMEESLIEEAGECGLKSILILMGVINRLNYTPRLLSYEAPFGVGYLTMSFE